MDIRHLEYFLQVVKDKNITKAAKNLFLTQPALSKTIKNLEEDLGVELLVKTPRGVEPTDCGIQLAESAAPLVNAFSHIQEQLHDLSELKTGQVSIGVGPMFGFAYICEILAEFQKLYPNIEVNLQVLSAKKIKTMLHNYELDIAIFNSPQRGEDLGNLEYTLIHQDVMALTCNKDHPLCNQSAVNVKDLQNEPLNICSSDYALYDMIVNYCHDSGFDPQINFVCNSMELLLDMTASGKGICILPRPYLERISICFPSNQILKFDPALPWSSCLFTRKGSYHSYSSLALGDFIEKYFENKYPE